MIVLKNITRNNDNIVCDAYVEDCKECILLSFNEKSKSFAPYTLPKDYAWCDGHIAHAARYMESLVGKEISPHDRTIMWY